LGPVHHTPEIDVHDAFDVFEIGFHDIAVMCDTGVVVDLVHDTEMLFHRIGVQQDGLAFGDVEPVGFHLGAQLFAAAHGFGQALGIDIGERQLRTAARQVHGQCAADTGPGAGDNADLVAEISFVAHCAVTTFSSGRAGASAAVVVS